MDGPSVAQQVSQTNENVIARVREVDAEAGRLLSELPDSLVTHLSKMFQSPKTLAMAILAVVHKDSVRLLSMKFRVPTRWVQRASTSCLRALRQKQVNLWKPKTTPRAR